MYNAVGYGVKLCVILALKSVLDFITSVDQDPPRSKQHKNLRMC